MVAFRAPDPMMQLFDNDGNPLSGGKVYTYAAGTLTPLATYADYDATAFNTNPIVLDSAGRATVFWSTSLYDVVVTDSSDNQLYTVSSFSSSGASSSSSNPGFGTATTIESATTVDLGTISSHFAFVTGTTPTTSFGSSASTSAPIYLVKAQSPGWEITLSSNIICPFVSTTLMSIQSDCYWMEYLGSGVWRIFGICRGDGSADFTTVRATQIIQNDA